MDNIFLLSDDWGNLIENGIIVPFGVGRIGRRVIPTLMKQFKVPFLLDNNNNLEKEYGLDILNIDKAMNYLRKEKVKVVVTTVVYSYEEIKHQLEYFGFVENVDFCIFERFAEEWNLRWGGECVLSKIDTVITSRCSLKCKNCNIFISHVPVQNDIQFKCLKSNFDIFFDSVDYVYEYTLLGGEPFLHKEIVNIISYLGDKYYKKIGKINIISNGTIIPNQNVIEVLQKYNVTVHISDYTNVIDYTKKLVELRKILSVNRIEYYVIPNNTWKDVVYPNEGYSTGNPKNHMLLCGHSTHSVGNGRLYWCDPAFAAENFMGFKAKKDDSLDLAENKKNNSKYEATLNIMKYLLGEVNDKGYMSICKKCAGLGCDNNRVVTAGIQIEREG